MRGADSVEIIEICRRGRENDVINIGVQANWVEMMGICRRGRKNDVINMAYKRIGWK